MKALALLSGGLDSILAVKLIQEQGIEVVGVAFTSPFFGAERAAQAASFLGIPLHVVDITKELLEVLVAPRHGYGKNLNPCIDCHALMVRRAKELLPVVGASFIITGEVLGERPMSQNAGALRVVARESGAEDLLLRPLSAKHLPPTLPERAGWVDRERLGDIKGRSRKPQLALAEKYGLTSYPTPAGGCLLTDPGYARRLKAYLGVYPQPDPADLELLKCGRHFWTQGQSWIVVARREEENKRLAAAARPDDYLLRLASFPGPLTLVRPGSDAGEALKVAAALTARYSKARDEEEVEVVVRRDGKREAAIRCSRPEREELAGRVQMV